MTNRIPMALLVATVSTTWGCPGGGSNSPNGNHDAGNDESCRIVEVADSVDSNTTWAGDTTYRMSVTNFKVRATLNIGPGAVLKFRPDEGITITALGQLVAAGTADKPVVFTADTDNAHGCNLSVIGAPKRGYWLGISSLDLDDAAPLSQLSHVQVYYAGETGGGAVVLHSNPMSIESSEFAHNAGFAVTASDVDSPIAIKGNVFYDNEKPLEISAAINLTDADGNTFHQGTVRNDQNGVFIHHEVLGVNAGENVSVTWGVTEVPFVMSGDLFSVAETNTLTVGPGTVIKNPKGAAEIRFFTNNLHVGAGAIFTSLLDDAHGGDTNGDGAATTPAAGDWDGIWDERFSSPDPKEGSYVRSSMILFAATHPDHPFTFPAP